MGSLRSHAWLPLRHGNLWKEKQPQLPEIPGALNVKTCCEYTQHVCRATRPPPLIHLGQTHTLNVVYYLYFSCRTCVWKLTSLFGITPTCSSFSSPWCWWLVHLLIFFFKKRKPLHHVMALKKLDFILIFLFQACRSWQARRTSSTSGRRWQSAAAKKRRSATFWTKSRSAGRRDGWYRSTGLFIWFWGLSRVWKSGLPRASFF